MSKVYGLVEFSLVDDLSRLMEIRTGGVGWYVGEASKPSFALVDNRFDYYEHLDSFKCKVHTKYSTHPLPFYTLGDLRRDRNVRDIKVYHLSLQVFEEAEYEPNQTFNNILLGTDLPTGYTIVNEMIKKVHQLSHLTPFPESSNSSICKSILITSSYPITKSRHLTEQDLNYLSIGFFEEVGKFYTSSSTFRSKVREISSPKLVTKLSHQLLSDPSKISSATIEEINTCYEQMGIEDRLIPFEDPELDRDQYLKHHLEIGETLREIKTLIDQRKPVVIDLDRLIDLYNKSLPYSSLHLPTTIIKQTVVAVITGYTNPSETPLPCTKSELANFSKEELEAILSHLTELAKVDSSDPRLSIMNDVVAHIAKS